MMSTCGLYYFGMVVYKYYEYQKKKILRSKKLLMLVRIIVKILLVFT